MRNKNFKWQLPISIVMLVLVALCGLLLAYCSGVKPIFYLILIPSAFLLVQITALFHEFGHYIATAKNGFEVYFFKFSCFTIDKFGRKKIRLSLFNKHLGEIRFYPKNEGKHSDNFLKSLHGGLIGNLLVAIILNTLLLLSVLGAFKGASPYMTLAFAFSPYALYSYLINVIPWFHPENDGSQIKRIKASEKERQAIDNLYNVQKLLFDGKTYEEIPKGYFNADASVSEVIKTTLTFYALKRAIELEDCESAGALATVLENAEFTDDEIWCELLSFYVMQGDSKKIEEYSSVLSFNANSNDPTVFRAILSYAKYRGDNEYLKVATPTFIKLCENAKMCKGDALYNLKLIKRL